ncbi:MAG: hypothetical protein U0984_09570 [Prosthecobacter sp.]|nr:hypothetical protein [Prosthecobacter sp.]
MTSWWASLTDGAPIYWCIAIFASVLQVLLLLGSFLGGHFGVDHGDAGPDTSGGDSGGVKILSLRVLVAFFVGFGWAGVLGLRQGMSGVSTAFAAMTAGVIFMALLFFTLRFLIAMRDDGTLNYANALGLEGQVYVTVPAARSGPGQVEIMLQGRLITATAVTDAATPLPPRLPITVTAVEAANLLVVQPLNQETPDHV